MKPSPRPARFLAVALLLGAIAPAVTRAQAPLARFDARSTDETPIYDTPRDSLAAMRTAARARAARDYRVLISLAERRLWVVQASDTIMSAPVGIGTGGRLRHQRRLWVFKTPRGVRTVQGKRTDPVWTPPDWNYVEVAAKHGLQVGTIGRRGRRLQDGRLLTVRDSLVGLIDSTRTFTPLPLDEHIVFGNTLYIPPIGTRNRRIEGELGKYALDTGDGYMLHGTPYEDTVGQRSSHGCIRLKDDDIAWLYENVPVGTKVYIF